MGWGAVFIGFLGVLLILHPEAGDFNFYALLPLVSAVLYALSMIVTRTRCRSVHPIMLSIALNAAFVVVGASATLAILSVAPEGRGEFLAAPWAPMAAADWFAMGLLAAAILIGSVGTAIAYQNGPPSIIGTFDFAYVGFALVWGLIIFGEVPDMLSLAGMGLIVIAGSLSLRQ